MENNQQKLRELVRKATIPYYGEYDCNCCNSRRAEIDTRELLLALTKKDVWLHSYEGIIGVGKNNKTIIDLTKPPLEQSEETLTELINLLS